MRHTRPYPQGSIHEELYLGRQADRREAHREARRRRGHDRVVPEDRGEPDAERDPVDRGDQRLALDREELRLRRFRLGAQVLVRSPAARVDAGRVEVLAGAIAARSSWSGSTSRAVRATVAGRHNRADVEGRR